MKVQESWKTESGKYACPFCGKEFTKKGISSHIWRMHGEGKDFKPTLGQPSPFKGVKGKFKHTEASKEKMRRSHKTRPPQSEEVRQRISESMKKAHVEGRAWNIGKSRWNNKPSYPEKFFAKVIENEFLDKEYQTEYNVSIYSIDFAWPHKKLAIEIDGEQHQRFDEYKERDKRKDALLESEGWKVLRIAWKDMCNDTKQWISVSNKFVGM